MSEAVNALVDLFELERSDDEAFVGRTSEGGGRLFGGLVLAQALIAAGRTTPGIFPHSLHAYFLRPGKPGVPIAYDVLALKDGKNFKARSVLARQNGDVIFSMMASFTRPEPGLSHQDPMPEAPSPETLADGEEWGQAAFRRARVEMSRRQGSSEANAGASARPGDWRHHMAIESRFCDGDGWGERPSEPRQRMWMRPAAPLPEDPLIHAAALVYASDRRLMGTGARPHRGPGRMRGGASLDHAVWFHRTLPFDDWTLYATESPVAQAGRPLNFGAMYRRDGTRVMSVAQEALIRFRPA